MLIDKEKKILDIIKQYQSENGYSPTFEAIAKMLGIRSTSTIHRYISALKNARLTGEHKVYINVKFSCR